MNYDFAKFHARYTNQVLKNGVEVKLQRNALSVLEPPTGNEEDDDFNFDDSSSVSDTGERDHRFIGKLYFLPSYILFTF